MSFLDTMWTLKILGMLITPFKDTKAYKLGIIDETGKNLIPSNKLKTPAEKDAFDMLDKFVFNLKKIINKLPGGESKLKSITAAYFLIKESYNSDTLTESVETLNLDEVTDDQILYVSDMLEKLLEDGVPSVPSIGGLPANTTGVMVSTDEPVISPRRKKKKEYKFIKRNITSKKT